MGVHVIEYGPPIENGPGSIIYRSPFYMCYIEYGPPYKLDLCPYSMRALGGPYPMCHRIDTSHIEGPGSRIYILCLIEYGPP